MKLLINDVDDKVLQENFTRIQSQFNGDVFGKGHFKFFDVTISTTGAYPFTKAYAHNLGYVPLDVIQTRVTGGTVTWNYTSFTDIFVNLTVSAATRVRFFLGRYDEANL